MSISAPAELENLNEILTLDPEKNTLENCYQLFQKYFGSESFKPCYIIGKLLEANIITYNQRLIAVYLLSEVYYNKQNPFALHLINICENSQDNFQKQFIYDLLTHAKPEIAKITLKQLFSNSQINLELVKLKEDFFQFKAQIIENMPKVNGFKQFEISNVVQDFYNEELDDLFPEISALPDKVTIYDLLPNGFNLDFMRPLPTPLKIQEEPTWLSPSTIVDFCWDYTICQDSNITQITYELLQRAYTTALNAQEQQLLIDAFEKDPKLVQSCGFTPAQLPGIVEKNPNVACVMLTKLSVNNSFQQLIICCENQKFSRFLEKMQNMELSLPSLEVMNGLSNSVELPEEFLILFIENCIHQCNEKNRDKTIQNRWVRLVCVFVRSMIKNKNFNPKEMFLELQAFCIEFSKISEANSLFKMLKQIDPNQGKGHE